MTPGIAMARRKLVALVVGLAALVAVGAFVLSPRTDLASRITWQNFERITFGATRAEVENILGRSGDFTTEPTRGGRGGGISSGRPPSGPRVS